MIKTLWVCIALLGASAPALAQDAANTSGGIGSTVIQPIRLTKVSDMNFGSIVPGTGGSVYVTRDPSQRGGFNPPGGVVPAGTQGATETPADFTVTGAPGYVYLIHNSTGPTNPSFATMTSTTDATKHITLQFASPYITVAGTTSVGNGIGGRSQQDATAQLNASGNGAFSQGAVLTIAANQAFGIYIYTWTETVSYQ